jgi:outer membrane usher protein
VEGRDYPMSDLLTDTNRKVAPRRSSAVVVDFTPASHHAALITLVTTDGGAPPVGSRVDIAGSETPLIVGRDGQVFVADFAHGIRATVTSAHNRCSFRAAPEDAASGAMALVGPVLCTEVSHAL